MNGSRYQLTILYTVVSHWISHVADGWPWDRRDVWNKEDHLNKIYMCAYRYHTNVGYHFRRHWLIDGMVDYFWALQSFHMFTGRSFHVKLHLLIAVSLNAPRELRNPMSDAVPGKFHGFSGHNKQDRVPFSQVSAWQIALIFKILNCDNLRIITWFMHNCVYGAILLRQQNEQNPALHGMSSCPYICKQLMWVNKPSLSHITLPGNPIHLTSSSGLETPYITSCHLLFR